MLTLRKLRAKNCWIWFYCNSCGHSEPYALAPLIIRYGQDMPVERLARRARCSDCGWMRAKIEAPQPIWQQREVQPAPFPKPRAHIGQRHGRKVPIPVNYTEQVSLRSDPDREERLAREQLAIETYDATRWSRRK